MPLNKILKKTKIKSNSIVEKEPVLEPEIDTKSVPAESVPTVDRFKAKSPGPQGDIKTAEPPATAQQTQVQSPQSPPVSAQPAQTPAAPIDAGSQNIDTEPKSGNILWKVIPALLILMAIASGIWLYKQGLKKEQNNQQPPQQQVGQKIQESPSQQEATHGANVQDYKIKVLNGSGIAGEAAKLKDLLEQVGFTVESIGNTDKNDYEKTVVRANNKVPPDAIAKLKEFLKKNYSISEFEELTDAEGTNILIIIGREKTSP